MKSIVLVRNRNGMRMLFVFLTLLLVLAMGVVAVNAQKVELSKRSLGSITEQESEELPLTDAETEETVKKDSKKLNLGDTLGGINEEQPGERTSGSEIEPENTSKAGMDAFGEDITKMVSNLKGEKENSLTSIIVAFFAMFMMLVMAMIATVINNGGSGSVKARLKISAGGLDGAFGEAGTEGLDTGAFEKMMGSMMPQDHSAKEQEGLLAKDSDLVGNNNKDADLANNNIEDPDAEQNKYLDKERKKIRERISELYEEYKNLDEEEQKLLGQIVSDDYDSELTKELKEKRKRINNSITKLYEEYKNLGKDEGKLIEQLLSDDLDKDLHQKITKDLEKIEARRDKITKEITDLEDEKARIMKEQLKSSDIDKGLRNKTNEGFKEIEARRDEITKEIRALEIKEVKNIKN
jgi:hypothetical protein